jgi:hypothetical protein
MRLASSSIFEWSALSFNEFDMAVVCVNQMNDIGEYVDSEELGSEMGVHTSFSSLKFRSTIPVRKARGTM